MARNLTKPILPIILVLSAVFHHVTKVQSVDPCFRYDVNGCSIPFGLPFFFKGLFTPSCNRHDVCYHCGVGYNITRKVCDLSFKNDMTTACRNRYLSSVHSADKGGDQDGGRPPCPASHDSRVLQAFEKHYPEFLSILEKELESSVFYKGLGFPYHQLEEESFVHLKDNVVEQWGVLLSSLINQDDPCENQAPYQIVPEKAEATKLDRFDIFLREHNSNGEASQQEVRVQSLLFLKEQYVQSGVVEERVTEPNFARIKQPHFMLMESLEQKIFCDKMINILEQKMNAAGTTEKLNCRDIQLLLCNFFAEIYFLAVHFFGGSSYHPVPEFYCDESFVPGCLPPRH